MEEQGEEDRAHLFVSPCMAFSRPCLKSFSPAKGRVFMPTSINLVYQKILTCQELFKKKDKKKEILGRRPQQQK